MYGGICCIVCVTYLYDAKGSTVDPSTINIGSTSLVTRNGTLSI